MNASRTSASPSPDLTRRAPRSLRCRLGGYAVLPRMLDKCRAAINGQLGEYHFNCPLDQQFFGFAGIDAEQLKTELAKGKSDSEILEWIRVNSGKNLSRWEIERWSAYQETRLPDSDPGTTEFFASTLGKLSMTRTDIHTWADLLDLDDHCTFGGTA